ncbi:MAG: domain S-box protein [Acidimicrobiales bacterium]|nr:domain S-box protein [Acidimicrobiales bacterium]
MAHGEQPASRDVERLHEIVERSGRADGHDVSQNLGSLAAGIAHDVNNLLGVVLNYTRVLLQNQSITSAHDDVEQVRAAAERAVGLTRQLVTLGHDATPADAQQVDLNDNVRQMSRLMAASLGAGVTVVRRTNVPMLVRAASAIVDQILVNLILNANESMPDGGTLTIETRWAELDTSPSSRHPDGRPGRSAEMRVSDTGCGMSQQARAHAFDAFYTTRRGGTGLGLASVRRLVTEAGGLVMIDSAQGVGTTVTVRLPSAAASTRAFHRKLVRGRVVSRRWTAARGPWLRRATAGTRRASSHADGPDGGTSPGC